MNDNTPEQDQKQQQQDSDGVTESAPEEGNQNKTEEKTVRYFILLIFNL